MSHFGELMETFLVITTLLGFIQIFLRPFDIDFIEKSMFSFFEYCNNSQLIYLSFSVELLIAIIIYYRKDVKLLCEDALLSIQNKKLSSENLKNFCFMTVPAIIIFGALSVLRFFHTTLQLPSLGLTSRIIIPNIFVITVAIILFFYDRKANNEKKMTEKDAKIIGLVQLLSIFPGIFRIDISFITMRYLGFSRLDSFRNFALLSLPLQIGSCIFQTINFGKIIFSEKKVDILWPLIGGVIIFFASFALLRFINWFLKKFTLQAWVIYRIFMSSIAIIYFLIYVFPNLDNVVIPTEEFTDDSELIEEVA